MHILYELLIILAHPIRFLDHCCTLHTTDASSSTVDALSTQDLHSHYKSRNKPLQTATMVKWEHALNAHILAAALAVSEVTATNEMAEAAQAAWSKYSHLPVIFLPIVFHFHPISLATIPSPSSFMHFYAYPEHVFLRLEMELIRKSAPDLGEKPTVRAIRDQMRKLAADKKPKAAGKASGTTRAATKAKGKKRALDEAAAQGDEAAEPGAIDEGAGPDADEEVEPALKQQKRKKAVGGKKI